MINKQYDLSDRKEVINIWFLNLEEAGVHLALMSAQPLFQNKDAQAALEDTWKKLMVCASTIPYTNPHLMMMVELKHLESGVDGRASLGLVPENIVKFLSEHIDALPALPEPIKGEVYH